MVTEYKQLVLQCLKLNCYPVLSESVMIDIYYKMIPEKEINSVSKHVGCDHPAEVMYEKENNPFQYVYLVGEGQTTCVHTLTSFDSTHYPLQCIKIKLYKNMINDIFCTRYETFEEEIYHFITYLNIDVGKIRSLLNLTFSASTRFLPRNIQMWIYDKVSTLPVIKACGEFKSYFGPTQFRFETRVIHGKLSACTSREILLSLNDGLAWKPSFYLRHHPYNYHYSNILDAFVPLAYNPLENPII